MKTRFARKFQPARRKFLKQSAAIGGGLSVGFNFPGALAQKAGAAVEINAWVVIRPDDAIIIRYARSEMGQGSMTSAPMLVAEELECDWRRVKIEYASANANVKRKRAWGDMAAVGSRTIRNSQEYLRKAGATARDADRRGRARVASPGVGMLGSEQLHHPRCRRAQAELRK